MNVYKSVNGVLSKWCVLRRSLPLHVSITNQYHSCSSCKCTTGTWNGIDMYYQAV